MSDQMCYCKNVAMGSYDNQVVLSTKFTEMGKLKDTICVDTCIAKEVQTLWNKGIITVGCCCGHGVADGYIQTTPEMLSPMLRMGYIRMKNELNPVDPCFYPSNKGRKE